MNTLFVCLTNFFDKKVLLDFGPSLRTKISGADYYRKKTMMKTQRPVEEAAKAQMSIEKK